MGHVVPETQRSCVGAPGAGQQTNGEPTSASHAPHPDVAGAYFRHVDPMHVSSVRQNFVQSPQCVASFARSKQPSLHMVRPLGQLPPVHDPSVHVETNVVHEKPHAEQSLFEPFKSTHKPEQRVRSCRQMHEPATHRSSS